ncbi:membrane bound O-acyl transferase family-domain-containing protein [Hypoxylon crocopeplum]|nr:membrane bound O-acyl transferase family-domain-containing protein [Hypoxylon crocopeplum]
MLAPCFVPIANSLLSFLSFHLALHTSYWSIRVFFFASFLGFSIFSFTKSKYLYLFPDLTSLWAQTVVLSIVHTTSLLFIERWPAPPRDQKNPSWSASLRATYWLWSNPQLLPEASKSTSRNEKEEQSLPVFLLLRLSKLPLYYYLHTRVIPCFFAEAISELYPEDVDQTGLLTRLPDVTTREVVVRSWIAMSWIWDSVVYLDGTNAVLASFAVLTGLDQPADWPPLFAQPSAACGLRNFWSRFWHQLAARPYKGVARVVVRGIGSVWGKMPTSVSRALLAFVVFLLSGLSHMAVSWHLGMRDTLDVQWFLLNFAGCLGETVVLSAVRYLAKRAGCVRELNMIERSWLGRMAGFTWVFAFFFWSVPLWKYPRLHKELMVRDRWLAIFSKMTIVEG